MAVKSTTASVKPEDGSTETHAREYTGMLDRISIYTLNYVKKKWTSIDDVSVTGGYTTLTPALDIKPDNDPPNSLPINKKSKGRLPMAILGSATFDVADIDLDTVMIAGTVEPAKTPSIEDKTGDGFDDLQIHVSRRDLISAMGLDQPPHYVGEEVEVTVDALAGCNAVAATDVILLTGTED